MLHIVTGNPRKYAPLLGLLAELRIELYQPELELPEWQGKDFLEVLKQKAQLACQQFGSGCLVDDSGLLLDAYPGFPGPLTHGVCKLLGAAGMARLLHGDNRAAAGWFAISVAGFMAELWHWQGEVAGSVDPQRPVAVGAGPLTQWFIPDEQGEKAVYEHRRKALESLRCDVVRLRQALSLGTSPAAPDASANPACVFCREFNGEAASIFHELLGQELPSRLIHATEHFLVFPPLGQFVEGGLLITTREHRISMADLADRHYRELERLMAETSELLSAYYGCRPLMFEHAAVAAGDKGTCCVDHAHLNVFPVAVDVHKHLRRFPHTQIANMQELAARKEANRGYLFLQTNEGRRSVYDAGHGSSQYIRKIVTAELGMPERWHWREYLGLEELKRTVAALSGWSRPSNVYGMETSRVEDYDAMCLKKIRDRWDQKAFRWDEDLADDRFHLNQDDAYRRFLAAAEREVSRRAAFCRERLLVDLGCATGLLLVHFVNRFAEGLGIDISPRMLSAAAGRGLPHTRFLEADCFELSRSSRGPQR